MAATVKYTTHTASILGAVEGFYADIEELTSEMQEWRDNLEEKFSQTEKYQNVSDCADVLENITPGDAPDELGEGSDQECSYEHGKKSSSKSPYPRWLRRDNAVNQARAAIDGIQSRMDELQTERDEFDLEEVDEKDLEAHEQKCSDLDDRIQSLEEYKNTLEEHADEAEGIEFPGAFG